MLQVCPFEECTFKCKARTGLEAHIADDHGGVRFRAVGKWDNWTGEFLGHGLLFLRIWIDF